MINESSKVPTFSSINDMIVVNTKQVTATDPLGLVSPLPLIGYPVSHHLTYVLHHHLIGWYRLQGKQAPIVYGWFGKF